MAVAGEERHGRVLSGKSATRFYNIYGTDDEDTARDYLLATLAPTTVNSIPRVGRDCDVVELGPSTWMGTAVYRDDSGQLQDVGDNQYSFETAGGREKLMIARTHIADYVRSGGGNAMQYFGLINFDKSRGLSGVEIEAPTFAFQETHVINSAFVDQSYKLDLADLTATMNDDTFRGFSNGEVLFRGARGTKRSGTDWEISYMFAASPNRSSFSIGHGAYTISVTAKLGWDYLWVSYEEKTVDTWSVDLPHTAHVEQVFADGDFDGIGI